MGRVLQSVILCCIFLSFTSAYENVEDGREEGENCTDGDKEGTCTLVTRCHVFTEGGEWWKIKICGFIGHDSVICCPARPVTTTSTTTTSTTTTTTTTPRPTSSISSTSTTEYAPISDYPDYYDAGPDGCPFLSGQTTEPNGMKSWDKCIEYQMRLVYPCEEPTIPIEGKTRVRFDRCRHYTQMLLIPDDVVRRGEFPHMVLLGYGRNNGTAVWQCSGTLISERFILTAAHCTRTRRLGFVNYVIVGAHKRTDDVEPWQVHRIKRIFKHPDFRPRSKHNDIALLEINPITLNEWAVPACLDVFGGDHNYTVATGWGSTSFLTELADKLKKETLTKFTDRECRDHYPVRRGGGTFDNTTQTCYGDYDNYTDICQGDSGGPLTILNRRLHCMYTVVGITSFGIPCGTRGQPGWFTKVSHYVPWIESIVWP